MAGNLYERLRLLLAQLDGRKVQWDAEVEQFIPKQAIGWKSVNGPKHTGRITFAPIGNDTLVQVTMNWKPINMEGEIVERGARLDIEEGIAEAVRHIKAIAEHWEKHKDFPD